MSDRYREITEHAARRCREIDERIDQIRHRQGQRGACRDYAVDAVEHAAVGLARALAAHDRCALQHERAAAAHDLTAALLDLPNRPARAAHHRAAALDDRVGAAHHRAEAVRYPDGSHVLVEHPST